MKIPIENTLQIRRTGVYCKQPLMEMTVSERDNSIISLQGRVQVPTGGKAREHYARTGGIPVPTVTVWMEEVKLIYLIR